VAISTGVRSPHRPARAQKLQPRTVRQRQVQQHGVEFGDRQRRLGIGHVHGQVDRMALRLQETLQRIGDIRLILDQKHAHAVPFFVAFSPSCRPRRRNSIALMSPLPDRRAVSRGRDGGRRRCKARASLTGFVLR